MEIKILAALLVTTLVIIGFLFYSYTRDTNRAIETYEDLIHKRDKELHELIERYNEIAEELNKMEERHDEVMEQLNIIKRITT